jgi:hypothetical protein
LPLLATRLAVSAFVKGGSMRIVRSQASLHASRLVAPFLVLLALSAAPAIVAQPTCVYGVSKSLCKARLEANWPVLSCGANATGTGCTTANAHQASLMGLISPGDPTCDEVPDLDGDTLSASLAGTLRLQLPKPYRGALVGRFSILQGAMAVAAGTFDGTLGVGTHHPAHCECTSGSSCEPCDLATYNPSSQTWSIHSEGFLEGSFTAGARQGCKLHWSYAGTFTAPGTEKGPLLTAPWDFCGTVDGVLECPCPQPAKPKHRGP